MLKLADNDKIMEENKKIQAVVAGHICLDVIPAFKKTDKTKPEEIMTPGKLINMGEVKVSTGGPVSNTGVALSTLGIGTKLMGKVGNDFFGLGVLKHLKERNADDGMIVMDGEETSYTIVIVPPGIDRILAITLISFGACDNSIPARSWEFDNNGNTEGWQVEAGISNPDPVAAATGELQVLDGCLTGMMAGDKVAVIISSDSLGIDITRAQNISILLKTSINCTTGAVQFITEADLIWNSEKTYKFVLNPNVGRYSGYLLDMSSIQGWTGRSDYALGSGTIFKNLLNPCSP